jgi:hypothetical protein
LSHAEEEELFEAQGRERGGQNGRAAALHIFVPKPLQKYAGRGINVQVFRLPDLVRILLAGDNRPKYQSRPTSRRDSSAMQAFHSEKEDHYHNNADCGPGSEIPDRNKKPGMGGKPLCLDCQDLNEKERQKILSTPK